MVQSRATNMAAVMIKIVYESKKLRLRALNSRRREDREGRILQHILS